MTDSTDFEPTPPASGPTSATAPGDVTRAFPPSDPHSSGRPIGRGRSMAALMGVTLLAGLVGGAWLMKSYGPKEVVTVEAVAAAPTNPAAPADTMAYGAPTAPAPLPQAAPDPLAPQPESGRISALEQRMTQIDAQAGNFDANTSRAEGLLVAFAARRAVERGQSLGYIDTELRRRFGSAMPRAVYTIIEASQLHVTADKLRERLELLEPSLMTSDANGTGFWHNVSNLFVVRNENAPSVDPVQRITRAKRALDIGRVDRAILEVEKLPGAAKAQDWLAAAKRYSEAQKALDLIESAAIQDPRNLQDFGATAPAASAGPAASGTAAPEQKTARKAATK